MLIFMNLNREKTLALIALTLAIFSVSSLSAPIAVHSAGYTVQAPEAFLLACRARGIDPERCREGFAKARQSSGMDHARELMTKCRLSGRDASTCQRLITASFSSPNAAVVNKVKAHCLRNNIKSHQCKSLIADKLGGGTDKSQHLMSRCTAVGLNELECKKRMDAASRGLRR